MHDGYDLEYFAAQYLGWKIEGKRILDLFTSNLMLGGWWCFAKIRNRVRVFSPCEPQSSLPRPQLLICSLEDACGDM